MFEKLEITPVLHTDALWPAVMEYARRCSWRAGPMLARLMEERAFTDWERVFAALSGGDIAGYCTLAKTDCVPGVPYTPYIGFVFVGEAYRGRRVSERLIREALGYARTLGFSKVYLVSGEMGLYEKYGFTKLGDAKDRWGNDQQIFRIGT